MGDTTGHELVFVPSGADRLPDKSFLDFLVLPHANRIDYRPVLAEFGERARLLPLRDDEAVLVEEGRYRVVPSPPR